MKKLFFTAALVLSVSAFAQKSITKTVGVPFEISYPDNFKQVEGEQENVVFQIFDEPNDFTLYIIQDPKEDWRETDLFANAEDVIKHYNSTALESLERNSALKIGDIKNETKNGIQYAYQNFEGDYKYSDYDDKGNEVSKFSKYAYITVGIKTPRSTYSVYSFCPVKDKARFEKIFKTVVASIKEK
ncbi:MULTISPECIES: hypothetical protein [Elizabethkingia]|uniref:PsbP C-terminal domain-containing protein n=1 Tax=Elizabethkingia meningoseptica TaxID=238 RepID=A0A1V3U6J9_ELIME|nr:MULTISPECIES: hypothetical protein [Elizabethkingia]AQX11290.1 hypothetical protein BBD35_02355 [Elizabethkingia meningoseptica]MBG0512634.1 hypothetical protein [Elizabethkingia meningoseptica]MDE5435236.1 hypothetical protein [Elizabethkingia meningoseptica]MDE5483083.1 hypothetical protein [Elizabethkingia meningoseptica]MDE5537829.1 hypothetical protein [Elizabethkingia meningoseptica]